MRRCRLRFQKGRCVVRSMQLNHGFCVRALPFINHHFVWQACKSHMEMDCNLVRLRSTIEFPLSCLRLRLKHQTSMSINNDVYSMHHALSWCNMLLSHTMTIWWGDNGWCGWIEQTLTLKWNRHSSKKQSSRRWRCPKTSMKAQCLAEEEGSGWPFAALELRVLVVVEGRVNT